eukprot:COSAG06_NODE_63411_length_262_cov_0.828221_1_plen_67_part_01
MSVPREHRSDVAADMRHNTVSEQLCSRDSASTQSRHHVRPTSWGAGGGEQLMHPMRGEGQHARAERQ